MASVKAPTRVDRVYGELRGDILGGRQEPGSRLPFAELASRYRASMGVIREALTRLQGEGLVEAEPQSGFRVISVSPQSLRDLTEARRAIEILVLRSAVENGDLAWESALLAAHHTLARTPPQADEDADRLGDRWFAAHAEFHRVLLAGCPNPVMLGVALSLRDAAQLYHRLSVSYDRTNRDVAGEHQAITDAALARDADTAAELLRVHIQRTTDILLAHGV